MGIAGTPAYSFINLWNLVALAAAAATTITGATRLYPGIDNIESNSEVIKCVKF